MGEKLLLAFLRSFLFLGDVEGGGYRVSSVGDMEVGRFWF